MAKPYNYTTIISDPLIIFYFKFKGFSLFLRHFENSLGAQIIFNKEPEYIEDPAIIDLTYT